MKVTVNLNDTVVLKLNAHGAKIYNDYYSPICADQRVNVDDVIKVTLWHMAHIFGPHLYNGGKLPFESTTLEITHS